MEAAASFAPCKRMRETQLLQAFSFNEPSTGTRAPLSNGVAASSADANGSAEQHASEDAAESEPQRRADTLCVTCLAPLGPSELSSTGKDAQQVGSRAEQLERACCRSCRQQILRPMRARRQPAGPQQTVADLLPSVFLDRLPGLP